MNRIGREIKIEIVFTSVTIA